MENLALSIQYYGNKNGVSIDLTKDVIVMDVGNGPYIDKWNISDKLPQPSMEELEALETEAILYYARQNKLTELDTKFNYALENGHTTSSFGVEIDANTSALRNIESTLSVLRDEEKEIFCDYENKTHDFTKQQLESIRVEIVQYIRDLRIKKWTYRDKINALTTTEEVNSFVINF